VAAVFGAQFTNAGYRLAATLPSGTYDLAAFPHSTALQRFTAPVVRRIIVP
jgi:hypothetical protein